MKLAFFHNLPIGGAKKLVYYQVKLLSKKHEITVYEYDSADQSSSSINQLQCKQNIYKDPVAVSKNRLLRDFSSFIQLQTVHKKIAADIDSNSYDFAIIHPDKYTQAPFILQYLKTVHFYYCHELLRIAYEDIYSFRDQVVFYKKWYENTTRYIRKYIDKVNAQSTRHILCNSEFIKQNIQNAYHKKATVCYPGVDTDLYNPRNEEKTYDILFIGEKSPADGYDLLSESLHYLKDSPFLKTLSKKSNQYTISEEELAVEYNRSKIIVCLSRNEPFGSIPLEAMACGIPVIAINEGGYKETIQDNITGFLVSPDPRELAKKIELLLTQSKLATKMGSNASRLMKQRWQWNIHMKKLLQVCSI